MANLYKDQKVLKVEKDLGLGDIDYQHLSEVPVSYLYGIGAKRSVILGLIALGAENLADIRHITANEKYGSFSELTRHNFNKIIQSLHIPDNETYRSGYGIDTKTQVSNAIRDSKKAVSDAFPDSNVAKSKAYVLQEFDKYANEKTIYVPKNNAEAYESDFGITAYDNAYLKKYMVADSNLSNRAKNALLKKDINSLYDLRKFSRQKIYDTPGLGRDSLWNIESWVIDNYGLFLDQYELMGKDTTFQLFESGNKAAGNLGYKSDPSVREQKPVVNAEKIDPAREAFIKEKMQLYFEGKEELLGKPVADLDYLSFGPLVGLQQYKIQIVVEVAYNNQEWLLKHQVPEDTIPDIVAAMKNMGFEQGIGYRDLAAKEYDEKTSVQKAQLEYSNKIGLDLSL